MNPDSFLIYFAAWTLCGLLGAALGSTGKKAGLGFALGILLGPLGLLLTVLLLISQRPPQQPTIIYMQPPGYSSPAAPHIPLTQKNLLDTLPDHLTIARHGEILGTWPLADVQDYLHTGHLLPTDHYQTPTGHWSQLSRTGLI